MDGAVVRRYDYASLCRLDKRQGVRTTLGLDVEVAAVVDEEMRRLGRPFQETVNGLLRLGLRQGQR